jgi:hypothetical protein
MSYVESETAETVAHMTEAAARKYVFCFRRAILAATLATAVSFPLILAAQAQQRNEGAYAEESSQELRKDQEQQRTLRALDLDLHGSQQESDRPSSKLDLQEQRLCDTAHDFCPNFHGDPD